MKYSASQVREENEQKILLALMEPKDNKLRWNVLKSKTKLSKRTLSKILQDLTSSERRILKRVVDVESGDYPPPVYYELIDKKALTLVDLFLTQLKTYGENISEEDLTEGKKLLTEEVLQSLSEVIFALKKDIRVSVHLDFEEIFNRAAIHANAGETIPKTELSHSLLNFFTFKDSREQLTNKDDEKRFKDLVSTDKDFMSFVNEQVFNPYIFHIILQIITHERKVEKNHKSYSKLLEILPIIKKKHLEKNFDEIWEWWSKKILLKISGLSLIIPIIQECWLKVIGFSVSVNLFEKYMEHLANEFNIPKQQFFKSSINWLAKQEI
jgi:hypothetical protein